MPGGVLKLLGLKPEKVVESVGTVLDNLITNKEELARAKLEAGKEINRHFENLAHLDLETFREEVKDKADARDQEVQLRNTVGVWVQNAAAVVVIIAFVSLLFVLVYHKDKILNEPIFNILLGSLGTIVVQIFQYWFGSSAGSARKQQWFEK